MLLPLHQASTDASKLAQSINIPTSSSFAQDPCIIFFRDFSEIDDLKMFFCLTYACIKSSMLSDLQYFLQFFPIFHFYFPNKLLELSPGKRIEEKAS